MIKYIDSIYMGDPDMDNIGLSGTRVNHRRMSNAQIATAYDKAREIAKMLDRCRYHTMWMGEHHFQHEGYVVVPNVLMLGVHLAQYTESLKFGCAVSIVPVWHPLRLAEDFAMADILTKGRMVFGVGRGTHTRDVMSLGAPEAQSDASRDLFEEQIEIILKAFNEDSFSHQGKHYTIPARVPYRGYDLEEITLVPRPINRPVEIWQPMQSSNTRGAEFMVKHGIKALVSWSDSGADARIRQYQATAAAQGRDLGLGEDVSVGFTIFLDDSREKGMRAARLYHEERMKYGAPLGWVRGLTEEHIALLEGPDPASIPGLPPIDESVQEHALLCGTPDEVKAFLREFEQKYPAVETIIVGAPIFSPEKVVVEQLEWFAKEVMPAITPQPITTDGN